MRCSECSTVIKPVVAIDIDGTLGDYHGHFMTFALAYLGASRVHVERKPYRGERPMKEWLCEAAGIDRRTWHDIKLAYRQGAQKRSMPAYDGAAALCETVRATGAELYLTTTRPYMRLDNVDPDTRWWLSRNQIEYDGLLYDEDKYKVLASNLDAGRVVAVLDDLPEQYDAAAEVFGEDVPILRRNAYNTAVNRPHSQGLLWRVAADIENRIYDWRDEYDQ